MKKVKHFLSSVRRFFTVKKCTAVVSAAAVVILSVASAIHIFSKNESHVKFMNSAFGIQKMNLQLSEPYLLQKENNSISARELTEEFSFLFENESLASPVELSADSESGNQKAQEVITTEVKTEKTPETTQAEIAAVNARSGGYTFSELGITQMSDIPVPDDILFDEDGIPLEYSYVLSGKSTTYTMGTTTATGTPVHPGVIAVNPNIIPYGSKMYIVASDGSGLVYGYSSAEDTGGFIYWTNGPLVDMYVNSYDDAVYWGNKPVTIYVF